jgi:hypothetical protein
VALPPISGQAIQSQTQPTRSVADARAAQRAFFEAALNKAQAPSTTQAVQKAAAVAPRPAAAPQQAQILPTTTAADAVPSRLARPGSLLNIVV